MRVVIGTLGSGGDVHPYIALGVELQRRGHDVVLIVNPHFHARAQAAGLRCEPLGTEEQYHQIITSPELVNARTGPRFVLRALVREPTREMFIATRRLIREHHTDVVVRHLIAFGAGWAADHERVPVACGVLAPLFWLSRHDPPAFQRGVFQDAPMWLRRLRLRTGRLMGRFVLDPLVNQARRDCGLPPTRRAFLQEIHGGHINLGLWSPAYRPPMPDDPPHSRVCGFCPFDGDPALPPALGAFLDAGPPPIVFTLGTSVVHHAGDYYHLAADAAASLGCRAVLLAGQAAAGLAKLGPHVHAEPYAPFAPLLQRAAAVVHHGGIGTTGSALRAGRPQVIIPFANDEFDNADRARRLGVSLTLHTTRLNHHHLACTLRRVLEEPAFTERARTIAAGMAPDNGPAAAADAIEGLVAQRRATA